MTQTWYRAETAGREEEADTLEEAIELAKKSAQETGLPSRIWKYRREFVQVCQPEAES